MHQQITKNKITKSILSFFILIMIFSSVLFLKPKETRAQVVTHDFLTHLFTGSTAGTSGVTATATTTNTALKIKDVAKEILKQIIMTIQKRLLAEMTKSMTNWINSGFHGSPLFLENPESFFKDIGKYEIKTFVDLTGYDPDRLPFGKDFALNVIGSYKNKFEQNAQYSLSKAITDPVLLKRYRTDFNYGGWNAFLTNSMYPQNNYIGYQMLATEDLMRRLDGTVQNNANKVQKTLAQGMGFLSPQTCPSNPKYNNGRNEFQKPTFKTTAFKEPDPIYADITTTLQIPDSNGDLQDVSTTRKEETAASIAARKAYSQQWSASNSTDQQKWATENTCPGGLVSTTPGSVVASQITNAMSTNFRQSELGAALGNSMSAIFDALLNKFIGSGLNALATKTNTKPKLDDWSYEGQTLGSPVDGTNTTWDTGPDEEISLDAFKKQLDGHTDRVASAGETIGKNPDGSNIVALGGEIISEIGDTRDPRITGSCSTLKQPNVSQADCDKAKGNWTDGNGKTYIAGDIYNTQKEIDLLGSIDPQNPGILQMISMTWPEVRALDMCIPGPNLGWEDRLIKEMDRNSQKLQEKSSDQDGEKAAAAQLIYNDLQFAVKSFKDWVDNKMLMSLPGAINYMDAVKSIDDLYQQSSQITDTKRAKSQALARLLAIKPGLDALTTQPVPGTAEEKVLVDLRKKYNPIKADVSNSISLENTQNDLNMARNKYYNYIALTTKCKQERKDKGYSEEGGPNSSLGNTPLGTCTFSNGAPTIKDITENACKAKLISPVIATYIPTTGLCVFSDGRAPVMNLGMVNCVSKSTQIGVTAWTPNPIVLGSQTSTANLTEQQKFCDLPIKNGYAHGAFQFNSTSSSFVGPRINTTVPTQDTIDPEYRDLPLVNGQDLLRYTKKLIAIFTFGLGGQRTINMQLSCDIIFNSTIPDYKKDLPGFTSIIEKPIEVNDADDGTSSGTCSIGGVTQTGTSLNNCLSKGGSWTEDSGTNNNPNN